MSRKELIAKIREARIAAAIYQGDAAKKAGISQPTWANVESESRTVAPETLIRMAAAVGLDVSHLPEKFVVTKNSDKTSRNSSGRK